MRRFLIPLLLALSVLAGPGPGPAVAQTAPVPAATQAALPDWQHTSINDFAGLLTQADTQALDEALIALHGQTGVQGTVVTITDRARHGGTDGLERFSTRLFNHWGVGDATRNDGFMLLVSRDDREARIELGRGYPPEAGLLAQDIMNRVMLPSFREGDYSRGLREGTLAVIDRIARPHAAGQPETAPRGSRGIPPFALFLGAAAGMFGLSRWDRRRRNRCPQCGHQGLTTTGTPLREDRPGGGWRTAMQTRARICPSCGWQDSRIVPLPVITYYDLHGNRERVVPVRATSTGSAGFGGGSSSGGGASGRW